MEVIFTLIGIGLVWWFLRGFSRRSVSDFAVMHEPTEFVPDGRPLAGVVYKQVRVPAGNSRRTEKILNRYARQGWTLLEIKKGGLIFGSKDTAIMFRPVRQTATP